MYKRISDYRIALPHTADMAARRWHSHRLLTVFVIVGSQKLYYVFGRRVYAKLAEHNKGK